MILDLLSNAEAYFSLSTGIARAFEFLRSTDFKAVRPGRIDLHESDLYALVSSYVTRPACEGAWEAHRKYADLQYMAEGEERIGYGPLPAFAQGVYDAGRDFVPLLGSGDFAALREGGFMLLFPWDAHMPGIASGNPSAVLKVVVKIPVSAG